MKKEVLAKDVKSGDAIFTSLKQRKPTLVSKVWVFDEDTEPAKKGDVLLIAHDCRQLLFKPDDIVFKDRDKTIKYLLSVLNKRQ